MGSIRGVACVHIAYDPVFRTHKDPSRYAHCYRRERQLQEACDLFDDTSPILIAAFRHDDANRFLHFKLGKVRSFFKNIGFRSHAYGCVFKHSDDYQQCLLIIQARLNDQKRVADPFLAQDSQIVLAPLTTDSSLLTNFHTAAWDSAVKVRAFRTQIIVSGESQYRQSGMAYLAVNHQALAL